jgi:hypothetical protein
MRIPLLAREKAAAASDRLADRRRPSGARRHPLGRSEDIRPDDERERPGRPGRRGIGFIAAEVIRRDAGSIQFGILDTS